MFSTNLLIRLTKKNMFNITILRLASKNYFEIFSDYLINLLWHFYPILLEGAGHDTNNNWFKI